MMETINQVGLITHNLFLRRAGTVIRSNANNYPVAFLHIHYSPPEENSPNLVRQSRFSIL